MIFYETDRLILRNLKVEDVHDYLEFCNSEFNLKYDNVSRISEERLTTVLEKRKDDDRYWAVILKSNQKLIGSLEYEPDEYDSYSIGYSFNEMYTGQGYAYEACKVLVHHVFTVVGARRITADMCEDNVASWKLAERLGLRREGHFIEDDVLGEDENGDVIYSNSYYYGMLKKEWIDKNNQ